MIRCSLTLIRLNVECLLWGNFRLDNTPFLGRSAIGLSAPQAPQREAIGVVGASMEPAAIDGTESEIIEGSSKSST